MSGKDPVTVALLGGGIFAERAYLPLLGDDAHDRRLLGVWSRRETTAASIAEKAGGVCYWCGDDGLDELLAKPELEAVLVVVAAQATLEVVRKALAAGKWVLSEKPAGPTSASVRDMLCWMESEQIPTCRWCVQENYRGETALERAADLVKTGCYGAAAKLDLKAELPMAPGGRYYDSGWRRTLPGSFLLEGGVHFVAGVRQLCAAAGLGEIDRVSAQLFRGSEGVPEPDTLVGWGRAGDGAPVSFSVTQTNAVPRFLVSFVGSQGTVEAQRGAWGAWTPADDASYTLHAETRGPETEPGRGPAPILPCTLPFDGVGIQVGRFLGQVAAHRCGGLGDGDVCRAISVEEAAQDLALMEGLLESGKRGGAIVNVEQFVLEDEEKLLGHAG